jgi:hypothetical protein
MRYFLALVLPVPDGVAEHLIPFHFKVDTNRQQGGREFGAKTSWAFVIVQSVPGSAETSFLTKQPKSSARLRS